MDVQQSILSRLKQEFDDIRTRNPSYSLRAFARRLDVYPSAISEILNGKRKVSRKMGLRIAERIQLDAELNARILNDL